MIEESLPQLTEAPIPVQTHILRPEERLARGRALRDVAARSAQADWTPPANRPDPVDLLIENSKGRMEELKSIRYGRMLASPFAFYRGAASIMAHDLSSTPSTGLQVLADGDCHLMNFGGFATAERKVIFDLNDFDEASFAPWEWDVKRLTASFVVAGRANGFRATDCREAAWLAAQSYRQRMATYAEMPVLAAWNDAYDFVAVVERMTDKKLKRFYTKKLAGAAKQSANEKEFAKLAFQAGATPRIVDQPPLIFHYDDQRDQQMRSVAEDTLAVYRQTLLPSRRLLLDRFEVVDYAMKVVGVGSVGTFCGILLLMSGNGDPLFLQFKEARQSVLEPYCGTSPFGHAGQRVVMGQRAIQAASDIFLGWATGTGDQGRHFFFRQLSDAKIKPVVEIMSASNLKGYAQLCGVMLARAHGRSGDAAVLSGYMGKSTAFEEALADFSVAYADQNVRDHAALIAAVRDGRVEAQMMA